MTAAWGISASRSSIGEQSCLSHSTFPPSKDQNFGLHTMMRQGGMVSDVVADMNAPLPPLNNLPQWARVGALDKARYPRPFLKDRLQPLPQPSASSHDSSLESEADRELDATDHMNPSQRVHHLERSINFLRAQHHEVLSHLHEEIDLLKRENKELNFRLVMMQKGKLRQASVDGENPRHSAKSERRGSSKASRLEKDLSSLSIKSKEEDKSPVLQGVATVTDEELKAIFLGEEIRELKNALKEEQNRNYHLTNLLEQMKQQQRILAKQQEEQAMKQAEQEEKQKAEVSKPIKLASLPFRVTTGPLQVHPPEQQGPRPPTMHECDVIIRHLQQVNDQQAHELSCLKTDLRDVLYSHKWTPDAYLLAKAYVAEDEAKEAAAQQKLPRIEMRQQTRKLPDIAYIHQETMALPALRQTMGNKAAERRRRTQVIQKSKLRREPRPAAQPAGVIDGSDM